MTIEITTRVIVVAAHNGNGNSGWPTAAARTLLPRAAGTT